jgi:hypothetical protein
MAHTISAILAIVALACGPRVETSAQQRPKDEDLSSIVEQLTSHRGTGDKVSFVDGGSATIPCGMQPTNMVVSRGKNSKSFPVLVDRRGGKVRQLFVKLDRMTVDADGASRAYHPDDPLGEKSCSPSASQTEQICALDNIGNADMRLFHGSTRLTKTGTPSDDETFLPNWRGLWPLISEEKLTPLRLSTIVGPDGPRDYNLIYWPERNLTFAFNIKIVPANEKGYPCRHGRQSKYPGYFLSATALKNQRHGKREACSPVFIDSETIPFFVIPKEKLDGVELGDIAVGILATPNDLRIVYGITGDTGPYDHFGEGSIAFNKTLLGIEKPIENAKDVNRLDIDISNPDRFHGSDASLAVLLLGGTKRLLDGDFSGSNIRKIGEARFKLWNVASGSEGRLTACLTPAQQ